jgi:hypothetical protein
MCKSLAWADPEVEMIVLVDLEVKAMEDGVVILETTPLTEVPAAPEDLAAMIGIMTTDPLETALAATMEDLTDLVPEVVEDFVEVPEVVVPEAAEAGVAIVEVVWEWKLHGPVVKKKIFQLVLLLPTLFSLSGSSSHPRRGTILYPAL